MPVRVSSTRAPSVFSTQKVSPVCRPKFSAVFSVRMALPLSKLMALCPLRVRKVTYRVRSLSFAAATMLTLALSPSAL